MARDFPGTNSNYLSVADAPSFDITGTALTLFARGRPDVVTGNRWLFAKEGTSGTTLQYRLAVANSMMHTLIGDSGGFDIAEGGAPAAGVWQSFVGVKNGTGSGALKAYLDGVEVATATSNRSIQNTSAALVIGNRVLNDTPFDGMIAEVAIWAAALTVAEIVSLAKGFDPRLVRPQSLRLFAPLGDGEANERDIVGGVTLTETGTVAKADHPRVLRPRPVIYVP